MPQTKTALGGEFTFPGTNLTVHRMGYGAMQLAGPGVFGPPKDHDGAINVLREAVAAGVNHIDTSDYYGPYVVNKLIREALHPYPKDLVIVSKLGAKRGADTSWNPAYSAAELESAVHDNLRHLGIEALDIVNLRIMGAGHGPAEGSIEDKFTTMAELQRKGLIRHIGLSNVTSKQVAEARRIAPVVCVQNYYNVAHREDDALIDELAAAGIAYVPFFPLGGFSPLQSSTLSGCRRARSSDADASGASVAAAPFAQYPAYSRHIVMRTSARKSCRGGFGAVAGCSGGNGCNRRHRKSQPLIQRMQSSCVYSSPARPGSSALPRPEN